MFLHTYAAMNVLYIVNSSISIDIFRHNVLAHCVPPVVPKVASASRRGRGRLSAATPIRRAEKVKVTIKAGQASTCSSVQL